MMRQLSEAPEELQLAVKEFWPDSEWDHAVSIAWLESGWNAFAENDSTRSGAIPCGTIIGTRDGVEISAERSVSWFQINACNFPTWNPAHLFNTRHNAGTAHALWAERGWQPWFFSAKTLGLI